MISATFHGRDLFAVAAARLAAGERWRRLVGAPLDPCRLPQWREPERGCAGEQIGLILHVDRFGNAITNLRPSDLPRGPWILRAGTLRIRELHRTYGDVAPNRPLMYIGSTGRLELAVRNGSAAARYRLRPGVRVSLRPIRTKSTA